MGTTVLADFPAWFDVETSDRSEPVKGRVVLGDSRLVLADDDETTIPLSAVFDVNVGHEPRALGPFPHTPVTVAYQADGRRSVAVVASEEGAVEKFATVLFKTLLNGQDVRVKHPARVGGRVTDASFRPGTLKLDSGGVQFDADGSVHIELSAVTDFDRTQKQVNGQRRPALVVSHVQDGTAYRTLAATDSPRTLSLLGRYLRRRYDDLMASLADVDLSESKVETLVTLYSTRQVDVSLASVVDENPRTVKRMLRSLHGDGLVRTTPDGPALTTRGQVVVNHYMERVNS